MSGLVGIPEHSSDVRLGSSSDVSEAVRGPLFAGYVRIGQRCVEMVRSPSEADCWAVLQERQPSEGVHPYELIVVPSTIDPDTGKPWPCKATDNAG